MSIRLSLVTDHNPFERFPALKNVWPEPYLQALAEKATLEDTVGVDGVARLPGPIFLIVDTHDHDSTMNFATGEVIGLTGFYFLTADGSHLGLRWHGLIPAFRGNGYSSEALRLVKDCAQHVCPQASRLVEYVPLNDRGPRLARHFESMGFLPEGDPECLDDAMGRPCGHLWQAYVLALHPPTVRS